MGTKIMTEWFDVEEDGLPVIGNIYRSCLFLIDGDLYEGWPVNDDYYQDMGDDIPSDDLREWETIDGETYMGVDYWAYKPEELEDL